MQFAEEKLEMDSLLQVEIFNDWLARVGQVN
jgi:hypothetical protein